MMSRRPSSGPGRSPAADTLNGQTAYGGGKLALTILALALVGVNEFTPMGYSIFKGVWAGGLAVVMAFPMILLGLATAPVPQAAT